MTSYPTICRACGGKIEKPEPDRHVCTRCEADIKLGLITLRVKPQLLSAWWSSSDARHLEVVRPDYSDLTPLIVRLPKEKFMATSEWKAKLRAAQESVAEMAAMGKRPEQEPAYMWWWKVFWFGVCCPAIGLLIAYWLGKQAGLWGS